VELLLSFWKARHFPELKFCKNKRKVNIMIKRIIAGNWKMNMSIASLEAYFSILHENLSNPSRDITSKVEIVLGVPFTLLAPSLRLSEGTGIKIAAQNVHWAESGAYTGEVSIAMLKELGIETAIIGHSERRQYFNETDESVAQKIQACQNHKVTAIACIGETLQQRQTGDTAKVIDLQLKSVMAACEDTSRLVIAYEPVWAIGSGLAATPELAQEVHGQIRGALKDAYGSQANQIPILYGGSMKPSNCGELLVQADIDGGLIGGASLDPVDFANMVNQALKN
jgi:triosephosphate isomerase